MADDLMATILRDYPAFAFLLNDPTFVDPATGQNLLIEAVNPNATFDAATFQAKLMNTEWWKNSSAPTRQWLATLNTDPAEAARQEAERRAQIGQIVAQKGLALDAGGIQWLTDQSLMQGVSPTDPTFGAWIAQNWQKPGFTAPESQSLTAIATHDYLMPLDDQTAAWWAGQIAGGFQTEQTFRAMLQKQAADRFPTLADQINSGVIPSALFATQRSAIAQQLEVSPDSIDLLNDPRWSQVLGAKQSDGTIAPMTLSQSIDLARSQPEWRKTDNANAMAAQVGQSILQTFGATK